MEIETIRCTIKEVECECGSEVEIMPHTTIYSPRLGDDIYSINIDPDFNWNRLEQLFTKEELTKILLGNETIIKTFNAQDLLN